MQVFIMRHGEAAAGATSDAARQLTEEGREDVVTIVTRYQDELKLADEVWCSRYTRAQQTAELVADIIDKPVVIQDWLTPTDNIDRVLNELREADQKTIFIVSHQPLVGILVDSIANLEPGRYRMGTAAIACIETDVMAHGCGDLRWLHQPQG